MAKIYARQVPPEYQESPLSYSNFELSDCWPGISLMGNRDFKEHKTPTFEDAEKAAEEVPEEYFRAIEYGEPYRIAEVLDLYGIEKHNGKRWSPRELGRWKRIFQDWERNPWDGRNADRRTLEALELITGEPHSVKTLRGYCPGDWVNCCYPRNKYSAADLERLETEYFNTGEEWTIYDQDPDGDETPSDIFTMYVYSWREEEKLEEIASAAGWGTAEEVELHPFTGWSRSPKWA